MLRSPYSQSDGTVKMLPSFVCYADILGYSQLSSEALHYGKGNQFLNRLRHALSNAYDRVRKHAEGLETESFYAVKVFTDNIVVGYPIYPAQFGLGEHELGDIFSTFAEFQAALAIEGFFIRGGIAFGQHYMDDDIVFGEALLEAVELDKSGGPPRISLAPSAIEVARKHLGFYADIESAPQYQDLMEDPDGTVFLNYLTEAFIAFPDYGVSLDLIEGHQSAVTRGLRTYKGKPEIRAKLEWAARYHNFVCTDFAERHPVPTNEDADEVCAFGGNEAQKLLNYLIDVESLATTPSRITLTPISR